MKSLLENLIDLAEELYEERRADVESCKKYGDRDAAAETLRHLRAISRTIRQAKTEMGKQKWGN